MIIRTMSLVTSLALAFWCVGCGSGADVACEEAASHVNQCFGKRVVTNTASCDAAGAERLLSLTCEQIKSPGKADGFSPEEVLGMIWSCKPARACQDEDGYNELD